MATRCHHERMMEELKAVAIKYEAEMPMPEMVALASQFVGGLSFLMDPEDLHPAQAGMMILANVKMGYSNARDASPLMNPEGSA